MTMKQSMAFWTNKRGTSSKKVKEDVDLARIVH
jgi:hypothetical protein